MRRRTEKSQALKVTNQSEINDRPSRLLDPIEFIFIIQSQSLNRLAEVPFLDFASFSLSSVTY